MTAEDHPDWPRVQKIVREFFERMREVEQEYSAQIALDDFGIVAMALVREGDEHEITSETVVGAFSTQRAHAQVGLLELACANGKHSFVKQQNEDE